MYKHITDMTLWIETWPLCCKTRLGFSATNYTYDNKEVRLKDVLSHFIRSAPLTHTNTCQRSHLIHKVSATMTQYMSALQANLKGMAKRVHLGEK